MTSPQVPQAHKRVLGARCLPEMYEFAAPATNSPITAVARTSARVIATSTMSDVGRPTIPSTPSCSSRWARRRLGLPCLGDWGRNHQDANYHWIFSSLGMSGAAVSQRCLAYCGCATFQQRRVSQCPQWRRPGGYGNFQPGHGAQTRCAPRSVRPVVPRRRGQCAIHARRPC